MPSLASRAIAYVFLAIILLAGPCLLALDAVLAIRETIFIRTATVIDGTILEMRLVRGTRNGHSYAPVFRFTADDGQTYVHVSNMSSNPPGFSLGQRVTVLYEHGHPENAKIDAFYQLWLPELVLSMVGGAFTTIPALVAFRRLRQSRA
jgi:uncharacterized protein DUF3592